ncbi:nucleoside-diphosphate sugar epimerase/dehydratase [Sphingomonas sp. PB2P19]|uniref:polysaccharide biosynthesis protein n=1 Tax=Sphingomonas rhamnosi TaxID=3096156 RepID=UPI002FC84B0D
MATTFFHRSLARWISLMSRGSKRGLVALLDAALGGVSVYLAVWLRLGEIPQSGLQLWPATIVAVCLAFPVFAVGGLYRTIFSQAGSRALLVIGRAVLIYGLFYATVFTFGSISGVPRTVGVLQPILLFLLMSISRVFAQVWLSDLTSVKDRPRVLIYGAGASGRQLAGALRGSGEIRVVGFIDDDSALHQSTIDGVPIIPSAAARVAVARLNVAEIYLALPSVPRIRRQQIIEELKHTGVHVRTLPGIIDLASGRVSVTDLRELDVEDLLGRPAIEPDAVLLSRTIAGKTVLVTGAGGSIGSELCRQIAAVGPTRLILFELNEYALYSIHQELLNTVLLDSSVECVPIIGSVLDANRFEALLDTWAVDTIYHAAAYKHVPLVEHNVSQGIQNNIFGTLTIARLAGRKKVKNFVLVSTDKAVRPTNVMGATKRAAELTLQALDREYPSTCFNMVRFGNVLGSSGSVVPLFRRQIAAGGPITITDFGVVRFFMTIPEAAQLVIQAGAMAEGGEVFVLDMGEPIKILDLAEKMIQLCGLTRRDAGNPDGEIEIVSVGLRPGEKLYEELLIGNNPLTTSHPRIFMAQEPYIPISELESFLAPLAEAARDEDGERAIAFLRELVPEFTPERETVDWMRESVSARRSVSVRSHA